MFFKVTRHPYVTSAIALAMTTSLTGCLGSDGSDGADGQPAGPIISNLSVEGSPIRPGGQVQVFVSANSPSGEPLSYEWSTPDGWDGESSDDDVLVLTAPDEQAVGDRVRVTVSDGNRSREAEASVATRGPAIDSWDVSFPADEPLREGDDLSIALEAFNRDGQILDFIHEISGLVFSDTGPGADWNVTQRSMGGSYLIRSTVIDGVGLTATMGTNVRFEGVSEWAGFGADRQRTGRSPNPDTQSIAGTILAKTELFDTESRVQSSAAIGPDGTLYVGSRNGFVYAIDPESKEEIWSFETDDWITRSSPVVDANSNVYFGSIDNKVYGLDANGAELWSFETNDAVISSPALGADDTLYVGSTDGRVYALDSMNGHKIWSFETESLIIASPSVDSSPALGADGTVYIGAYDNNVYALDSSEGTEIWSFETGGLVQSSPAVGEDGVVYIGSSDSNVYALDPDDGSKIWSYATEGHVQSSPALGEDGMVFVGSNDNRVYALNSSDGSKVWSFETGGSVRSSPAIAADGSVFVGSHDNRVYRLNPSDGTVAAGGSVETDNRVSASPAIGLDGTVYIGSEDGIIYSVSAPTL